MDDAAKRAAMRNYFFVKPVNYPSYWADSIKFTYLFVGIGLICLIYFRTTYFTFMVSFTLFAAGFFTYRLWINPYKKAKLKYDSRPTAEQMEQWLAEDLKNVVKPKAVSVLSLDESKLQPENFIIVPYPIFWQGSGVADGNMLRFGVTNGKLIYTVWRVQVLALTQHYISLFSCTFDWFNNTVSSPSTNEFFYDDISSIKNDMEPLPYKFLGEDKSIGDARIFRMTNISGETLSVITEIPSLAAPALVSMNLDKVIQILRIMLRNRRYGEIYGEGAEIKK